jgi:hypothetical protein
MNGLFTAGAEETKGSFDFARDDKKIYKRASQKRW